MPPEAPAAPEALRIVVFGPELAAEAGALGIADLMPRLASMMPALDETNQSLARVRARQHAMLREGRLALPSPFAEREDVSVRSYYSSHRAFYRFDAEETYFWATAMLDRAHAPGVLLLPARGIAISLYPHVLDAYAAETFLAMWRGLDEPAPDGPVPPARRIVPVGHTHMMHILWNELPAVDAAIEAGIAPLNLATFHRPFGPMSRLFPELGAEPPQIGYDELAAFNAEPRFFVPLGAITIPAGVRSRLQRAAREIADPQAEGPRQAFRKRHDPVFWISVKPPARTIEEQPAMLAAIMARLKARYPTAGFLLNGVSYPWDFPENPNYPPWFHDNLGGALKEMRELMGELLLESDATVRGAVQIVSGLSVVEEIAWGALCDFYFCHGGTMHNKIGWVHRKPGIIHSNARFVNAFRDMEKPAEDAPEPEFLTPDSTVDAAAEEYDPEQLARKDQNYRFVSADTVAQQIIAAYERSRQTRRVSWWPRTRSA